MILTSVILTPTHGLIGAGAALIYALASIYSISIIFSFFVHGKKSV